MRLAFFSWESLHSIAVGGIAAHVTELAAALERRGHEVHVFTRLGEGQSTHEICDGVHYHRCPIDLDPDFVTEVAQMGNRFIHFMAETEAHQGAAFDVAHGHDWLATKALVQAKNTHGRPTVMTVHSTEYGRCGNQFHAGQSERVRQFEREGTFVADRVITVSSYLADEVRWQYEVPGQKLRMVPNGIHCHRFDGYIDPGQTRGHYGVGPLNPMVLFVGRLSTQKGPDLLLEAVPEILHHRGDTNFVFVGDGDLRAALEHRSQELGIGHAVRFPGAMRHDSSELVDLFKSTDLVCVPSRNEPFGIVILEAWAAGKPVVVTRNGGPRDFITHGEDGFLVDDNPHSVGWGVNTVLSDLHQARHMGERGRVKAAFTFSWDKIAEQTETVYRELLG